MSLRTDRLPGDCNHRFYQAKSQVRRCHYCGEEIVSGDEESTWKSNNPIKRSDHIPIQEESDNGS